MKNIGDYVSFWQMGGYAIYVWPAYFITFLILVIPLFLLKRKSRQLIKNLNHKYVKFT